MTTDGRFAIFTRNADDYESFPVGSTVFNEGESGDCLFVVRSGKIALETGGMVLSEIGPGDVFGEMVLISRPTRTATARASEDTTVVRIDHARFDRVIQNNPFMAREFMRLIADRLSAMNERLKALS